MLGQYSVCAGFTLLLRAESYPHDTPGSGDPFCIPRWFNTVSFGFRLRSLTRRPSGGPDLPSRLLLSSDRISQFCLKSVTIEVRENLNPARSALRRREKTLDRSETLMREGKIRLLR